MPSLPYLSTECTFTGLAGVGKSAVAKVLAQRYSLIHMSAGDYYRALREERGLKSLLDLEALAETDPSIDFEIDERTRQFAKANTNFVFDGRLAGWCIPHAIKFLFTCDDEVRIKRVQKHHGHPSYEAARHETLTREQSHRERFRRYYKIEKFDDEKHFDFVIDTNHPIDEVVDRVVRKIQSRGRLLTPFARLVPVHTGPIISAR